MCALCLLRGFGNVRDEFLLVLRGSLDRRSSGLGLAATAHGKLDTTEEGTENTHGELESVSPLVIDPHNAGQTPSIPQRLDRNWPRTTGRAGQRSGASNRRSGVRT